MAKMPDFKKVKAFDAMIALLYGQFMGSGIIVMNNLRTSDPILDPLTASVFFIISFLVVGYERHFLFKENGLSGTNA